MTIGGYLVVTGTAGAAAVVEQQFEIGRRVATTRLGVTSTATFSTDFSHIAVFGGLADADVSIAVDPGSGTWLFTTGTWIHDDPSIVTDSQLLLRYMHHGPDGLAREMQGFFVVVAGDRRNHRVVVITDLIGSCRAYVRNMVDSVALSGSSLLLAALREAVLDPIGCQEFLGCGIVYEDRSCYVDVRKVAPASVSIYSPDGSTRSSRYWNMAELTPESIRGDEAVARFSDQLIESTGRIARRFGNPVCDLTAGYDSRGLVAGLLSAGACFTVTVSGQEDSPDVMISRELAEIAGLQHLHSPPRSVPTMSDLNSALQLTHGEYDVVDYARIMATHRSLSERFDISLNGSFGEVARGYWWELLFPRLGIRGLDYEMVARARFAPAFDNLAMAQTLRVDPVAHFTAIARRTNSGLENHPNTSQMDHLYLMMRMRSWQGAIASSTNRLWRCLSPFMLRPLMETILQTSARLRHRSLFMRMAILKMQPRLANHPLEHGYPAIPATFSNLHRFMPLAAHYGSKVLNRVRRKVDGIALFVAPKRQPSLTSSNESEAQSILKTLSAPLPDLLDERMVEPLIKGQGKDFAAGTTASRLLTLELALRIARERY
jgi:hypothetical protein